MQDYQELYATLFNAITDTIDILRCAQEEVERLYIENHRQGVKGREGKVIKFPQG